MVHTSQRERKTGDAPATHRRYMKLVAIMIALAMSACVAPAMVGPASPTDDPSWDRPQLPDDDLHWPAEQRALHRAEDTDLRALLGEPDHGALGSNDSTDRSSQPSQTRTLSSLL
jgi:hypothetical protein